jgi:hypothetical protein
LKGKRIVTYLERKIVYFEKAGKVNTEKALLFAKERAEELGLKKVVVASSNGSTARLALEVFKNTAIDLVVVGTSRKGFQQDVLQILENKGIPVRFSSEVEYAYPEVVMNAYRKVSEGMKVVMDLGMIVSEEGLVADNEEIVAVAGTGPLGFDGGGGADTAVVMVPRKSKDFFTLPEKKEQRRDIKELICKPR